ncbi:YeeE/YedE family protein [Salinispira pacifica]|uniref:Putative transport system permease protein n=1 Tax=Salinispira pacifica TaxID=1307761 RepID=V5WEX0_9SPIO|nr:YeeE/YedE family protein [Salinispira pacifica]AHC14363.1 Putative transport system permease protein [Salinispira pacifica]
MESNTLITIIAGLTLGTALGWVLQKGGFCMNTAFRSILFEKDRSLLRSWLIVLLINIPGVTLLSQIGVVTPSVAPVFWPALIIGGLIFGAGMVLAGGCASGTYYRAGRGMLGSWAALLFFLLGTEMMNGGILNPLQTALRRPRILGSLSGDGSAPTLFDLAGAETPAAQWLVVGVLLTALIIPLLRAPRQNFVIGWGWKKTGILVGVLALAVWAVSGALGRNFGLSFTQPSWAFMDVITDGDGSGVGLPLYILLGVPLGSYISAWIEGETRLSLPPGSTLVRQSAGGLLMGSGAALGGGCNIGHGISGVSALSIGSALGVLSIMAGCWVATWFVFNGSKKAAKGPQAVA